MLEEENTRVWQKEKVDEAATAASRIDSALCRHSMDSNQFVAEKKGCWVKTGSPERYFVKRHAREGTYGCAGKHFSGAHGKEWKLILDDITRTVLLARIVETEFGCYGSRNLLRGQLEIISGFPARMI